MEIKFSLYKIKFSKLIKLKLKNIKLILYKFEITFLA
jgi:hypothetical protein